MAKLSCWFLGSQELSASFCGRESSGAAGELLLRAQRGEGASFSWQYMSLCGVEKRNGCEGVNQGELGYLSGQQFLQESVLGEVNLWYML